jgi:guanine deaminase
VEEKFMLEAIQLAVQNVNNGGGPFAALVVKDGAVIATGVNQVTSTNDPTAHAEIVAIREACAKLKTFQLAGCEIYTSCEPCPMCLAAVYWARAIRVFFFSTKEDAAKNGFDDSFIYQEIDLQPSQRAIPCVGVLTAEALRPFEAWAKRADKISY